MVVDPDYTRGILDWFKDPNIGGIPANDWINAYFTGSQVDPRGGTYRDFEEPLSFQYGNKNQTLQIMDPMVQSLMTPEVAEILRELAEKDEMRRAMEAYENTKFTNPNNFIPNLGVGFGK